MILPLLCLWDFPLWVIDFGFKHPWWWC